MIDTSLQLKGACASELLRRQGIEGKTPIIPFKKATVRDMWYRAFDPSTAQAQRSDLLSNVSAIFKWSTARLREGEGIFDYMDGFKGILASNAVMLPDKLALVPVMASGLPFGAFAFKFLESLGKKVDVVFLGYSGWIHDGGSIKCSAKGCICIPEESIDYLNKNRKTAILLVDDKRRTGVTMHTLTTAFADMGFTNVFCLVKDHFWKSHPYSHSSAPIITGRLERLDVFQLRQMINEWTNGGIHCRAVGFHHVYKALF